MTNTELIEKLVALLPKEIKNDSGIPEIEYGRNVCRSQVIALLPQIVEVVEKAMVEKTTRVEVIDHTKSFEEGGGRVYSKRDDTMKVEVSMQDDGRTMKVFITKKD